jgi:hypothetical protein
MNMHRRSVQSRSRSRSPGRQPPDPRACPRRTPNTGHIDSAGNADAGGLGNAGRALLALDTMHGGAAVHETAAHLCFPGGTSTAAADGQLYPIICRGRSVTCLALACSTSAASVRLMIVWLNGTHGAGKTTTSALLQPLLPDSRVFDAEKVGVTLMDISPGLPETDNFQHWPPWRPLVVETARRVLDYTGGTLVIPMTVLVEQYWREISAGLAQYDIPVRHFVLHADQDTLRRRIARDSVTGPNSPFRLKYLEPYAEAARTWLHGEAEVVDTTHLTAAGAALQIAGAIEG